MTSRSMTPLIQIEIGAVELKLNGRYYNSEFNGIRKRQASFTLFTLNKTIHLLYYIIAVPFF